MKLEFIGYDQKYLKELIKIHRISFSDHFNSKLGNYYTKSFIKWFGTDHEFDNIFICIIDLNTNKLISYICGARLGYQNKMNKNLIFPTLSAFMIKPWLIFDRRFLSLIVPKMKILFNNSIDLSSNSFEEKLPKPLFSVTSFAIDEEVKKSGFSIYVLDKMFEKFFHEAKKYNAGAVRATINSFNESIFKYYTLRKWTLAPHNEKDKTYYFFRVLKDY